MMPGAEIVAMLIRSRNGMTYIVRDVWATSLQRTPAGPGYHPRDIYRPAPR